MKDGTIVQGKTGEMPVIENNIQTATTYLPSLPEGSSKADVEASIHSHPTEVQIVNNMAYPQSAEKLSGNDKASFSQFKTNIVVGRLGEAEVKQNTDGSYNITHTSATFLYSVFHRSLFGNDIPDHPSTTIVWTFTLLGSMLLLFLTC